MSLTVKSFTRKFLLIAASGGLVAACGPAAVEPPQAQAPAPVVEATEAPEQAIAEPAPPPEPDRLLGLNPRDVMGLLGNPTLVRRDGAVQVMLFENHDCVFEVVFREPGQNEYFQAHHIAARTLEGDPTDTQACLIQVLPNGQWPDN